MLNISFKDFMKIKNKEEYVCFYENNEYILNLIKKYENDSKYENELHKEFLHLQEYLNKEYKYKNSEVFFNNMSEIIFNNDLSKEELFEELENIRVDYRNMQLELLKLKFFNK